MLSKPTNAAEFEEVVKRYSTLLGKSRRSPEEEQEYRTLTEYVSEGNPEPFPGYKQWPNGYRHGRNLSTTLDPRKKNSVPDMTDLLDPLIQALQFTFEMKRKNAGEPVPYKGYCAPYLAVTEPQPVDALTFANDQTSDIEMLRAVLFLAFRQGAEYGVRQELPKSMQKIAAKLRDDIDQLLKGQSYEFGDDD